MNAVTVESVRTLARFARQRLPPLPTFRSMSAVTLENGPMPVIYAMHGLLNTLASYATSVLILAKDLLYVLYAAVDLCMVALATSIRNIVDVLGSRSMKSVWSVICRLKVLISNVRSRFGSIGTPSATSG